MEAVDPAPGGARHDAEVGALHGPARVAGAQAALWGFAAFGLGAAIHVGLRHPPTSGPSLAHLLYALFHPVFLGLGLAVALAATERLLPTRWRRTRALAAVAGSTALAAAVIPGELSHFAQRVAPGRELGLIAGGTLAFALLTPAVWHLAALLRRPRWRWLGPGAALGGALIEPHVLSGLYDGLHLYFAWLVGVFAASAMYGAPAALSGRRARAIAQTVMATGALASVLVPAPLGVRSALARDGGLLLSMLPWPMPRMPEVEGNDWLLLPRQRGASAPSEVLRPVKRPIVILLTVDALREDVLWRDDTRSSLPTLTRLAERGVYFADAHAPGSMTVNTLTSLFTGTLYSQQRWERDPRGGHLWPLHLRQAHFPRLLSEAGVRTINIPGTDWLTERYGIVGGFDVEEHRPPGRPAEGNNRWNYSDDIVSRMISELEALDEDQPAFLYGHAMDPHSPYVLGGTQDTPFEGYVAELARVDRQLGRLLRFLERSDLDERTYVFVSADHGEGFGERGRREHAYGLYEELIHVPLIVSGPGLVPHRDETLVSLTDLGPTILDLFEQPTPGQFVGESLLPLMMGRPAELTRPVLAETRLMRSLVRPDGIKVIQDLRRGTIEVYDLRADPEEEDDRVGDMTAAMARAIAELDAFYAVHQLRKDGYEPPLRN